MKSQTIPTEGRRSLYGGIVARQSQVPKQPPNDASSDEIEAKVGILLSEIDRCRNFSGKYIESNVLHSVPQTFVPSELCVELEAELNRYLMEQILREERLLAIDPSATPPNQIDDSIEVTIDPNICLACKSHCKWTPFCDANILAKRRKQLYRELISAEKEPGNTIQSVVARSALNGGETKFLRTELIKELSDEIQQIDCKLKLAQVDNELHRTHASREEKVFIRSIHGYDTTVKRCDAVWALEREHNRHVAQIAAVETIDCILEW